MTTSAFLPGGSKPPPSPGLLIATMLELTMLVLFIANRSFFGVLVLVAYTWFSATRSLVESMFDDD